MDGIKNISYIGIGFFIFLAVIFVLLTPFLGATNGDYGTYNTILDVCVPKSKTDCGKGGIQDVKEVCIPNPKTGKGCFRDGNVTYATFYSTQDCDVYCVKSDWGIPIESECKNGIKTFTKVCEQLHTSGVNNCYIETGNNGVIYYNIGDTYNSTATCEKSSPVLGVWNIIDSHLFRHLPRNQLIPNTFSLASTDTNLYKISSDCIADGVLETGTMRNLLVCSIKDKIYIPQNQHNPSNIYCPNPPSTDIIKSALVPCRYLPPNYPYYNIALPGGNFVVVEHLPGNKGNKIPFVSNVQIGTLAENGDIELSVYRLQGNRECNLTQVIRDTAVQFIFIPGYTDQHKIALIVASGYPGFLVVRDGRAFWTQAKLGPNAPGIDVDQAESFQVKFKELNSLETKINIKDGSGYYLRVKDINSRINIRLKNAIGYIHSVEDRNVSKSCTQHHIK